jgi:hypothetical protein
MDSSKFWLGLIWIVSGAPALADGFFPISLPAAMVARAQCQWGTSTDGGQAVVYQDPQSGARAQVFLMRNQWQGGDAIPVTRTWFEGPYSGTDSLRWVSGAGQALLSWKSDGQGKLTVGEWGVDQAVTCTPVAN